MSKSSSKSGCRASTSRIQSGTAKKATVGKPMTALMKTTPYSRQQGLSQGK